MDQGRLYSAGTNRSRTTADRTADGPETGGDQGERPLGGQQTGDASRWPRTVGASVFVRALSEAQALREKNCEMLKTV